MSDAPHDRFDLPDFVLGYLESQGSVVMPPAFGVYDVLLPEDVANQLAVSDTQRFTFAAPAEHQAADDAVHLSVNHPLVERIAQAVSAQPANGRAYINGVRLEKRGLADLARKTYSFPNARLEETPNALEQKALHEYLRFNFKVTLVSEEKQEELAAVVLDVQAGHAVRNDALLRQLEGLDVEPAFADLPIASPRWLGGGSEVSVATLQALLPRAEAAVRQDLQGQVTALTARMEHNLALDLARIGDYYDELTTDLERRRARVPEDDVARRQNMAEKLTGLAAERAAKLADARDRYGIRVDLELVNVLLISQPKVIVPVTISNRTVSITRTVVWDPLQHRLEPLVCDVCGAPGEGLHLCTGGHLAHAACLAPQCIDCKRAFCQLCAAQVSICVVCQQPVCQASLITCPTCRRGTCHQHRELCHAANGEPAVLAPPAPPPPAPRPSPLTPPAPPPSQPAKGKKSPPSAAPGSKAKPPAKATPPARTAPIVTGVRIEVEVYATEPTVTAFVMRSTKGILAQRVFQLTPQGLLVHCKCEKSPCPADGYYHFPAGPEAISEQVVTLLQALQHEYLIPAKKVKYYTISGQQVREDRQLVLPPMWRDPERLAAARFGFNELTRRR